MIKQLACIVLLFAVLVAARGGPNGGNRGGPPRGGHGPRPGYGNRDRWGSKLCANSTLAQQFLVQTQQLIGVFKLNDTFTQFVADQKNTFDYIGNADNTTLLSSNCTAFFDGLNNAKAADWTIIKARQDAYKSAGKAFYQIIFSLIGGRGNSDSDEDK